ncbi:unnamed protein product [Rangifer tarandus platyrhynchus]|uniref:Uncharacterized protein n=1 Tax=Rangifer tarandus platyrhynchus TaxID=3082113 RepID=A0ABN8XWS8_RANTA|nr:unnamed protein product [Rangifer tarandus platyrhynchus]
MVGAECGDGKFPGAHGLWKASSSRMEKQVLGGNTPDPRMAPEAAEVENTRSDPSAPGCLLRAGWGLDCIQHMGLGGEGQPLWLGSPSNWGTPIQWVKTSRTDHLAFCWVSSSSGHNHF